MFRDDKREGRGEEYLDDVRIYKGVVPNPAVAVHPDRL
jgi:hypothetical protein